VGAAIFTLTLTLTHHIGIRYLMQTPPFESAARLLAKHAHVVVQDDSELPIAMLRTCMDGSCDDEPSSSSSAASAHTQVLGLFGSYNGMFKGSVRGEREHANAAELREAFD